MKDFQRSPEAAQASGQAPAPGPGNRPGLAYRCRNDSLWSLESVSEGIDAITGFPAADFLAGRVHWAHIIHREDAEWIRGAVDDALGERRPYQLEYRIRHRDGSERWVWEQGQGIFDGSGVPLALEGYIADVSDHKRQGRELDAANQRLAAHMDNSPLAVIELDAQLRVVRWSDGAVTLFGWAADEVRGRLLTELSWVHPDERESLREVMEDMRQGKRPRNQIVNRSLHRDGGLVYCEWYNSAIYDGEGRLASILSQVLDVTERRRVVAELAQARRQAEERAGELETVLQSVPVAVWIAHDPEGRNISSNRTGTEWLRLPQGVEVSLTAQSGERPTHFKVCQNGRELSGEELPVQRAARGIEVRDFEEEIVFSDGSVRYGLGHATPLWDQDGRPRGSVAAFVDITGRKQAEAALREADRRKDEFLATLSHELRNPLAPILNAAEILRQTPLSDPAARMARDIIERQIGYMVRLIDDLMDVSRITRGKLRLREERVELGAVLEGAIESVRSTIESAGLTLGWSPPPQTVYLDADPVRLAQVFVNLLDNACKYTERGGRIDLTVEPGATEVLVRVADTGMGVDPEHLPRLFDMLRRWVPSGVGSASACLWHGDW